MTCKTCENELPENDDRFLSYCSEECLNESKKCIPYFGGRFNTEEPKGKFTDDILKSTDIKAAYPFNLSDLPTLPNTDLEKYGQYEMKPKKKKDSKFEYLILFFISGFISMKALAIFDSNEAFTLQDNRYLYLSTIMLIICLFSAAKANIFNIFSLIRKIPNSVKQLYNHMKNDYKEWKKNGVRKKL